MSSKPSRNNVAGIIIAAGESKRLGRIKQLLPWSGKTLIEFVIQTTLKCKLEPINVILGSNCDQIAPFLVDSKVNIIYNQLWKEGKGTSISLGINSLPENIDAAIIFVVDQPFLNMQLINTLIKVFELKKADIVAPYFQGIQTNPVLFNRLVFPELIKLTGEEGGRTLFNKFHLEKLVWDDEKILLDIDTFKDYEKIIN